MQIENCGCGGNDLGDLNWWQGLIKTGVDTTSGILSSRYGVPPAGSAVYRGADGSYQFVRTGGGLPGASIGTFGAPSIDSSTLIIMAVTVLGGILIFKAIK